MEATTPETDQLANLMTYTVFHIGVYISLGAAVIAGGAIKNLNLSKFRVAVASMIVAGACGGVIASCIPEYGSWADFKNTCIGPWGRNWFCYKTWATIEHLVFWIGVLFPAVPYVFCGTKSLGHEA